MIYFGEKKFKGSDSVESMKKSTKIFKNVLDSAFSVIPKFTPQSSTPLFQRHRSKGDHVSDHVRLVLRNPSK